MRKGEAGMNTVSAEARARHRLAIVDVIAYVVLTFCVGLAVAVTLAGVVLLLAQDARAVELQIRPEQPREVRQGTLLLKNRGETVAVPAVLTDVEIKVSGIVARARVRQTYRNPFEEWFEGIYVFPLPENAAVDHMRMRIGERLIEGEIKERRAARAAFEQAKTSGQRSALVEQERPNVFTTSVANLGPGQEIVVEIEYQQTLRLEATEMPAHFSLRFPLVVGPRYIPGSPTGYTGSGASPDTDRVPDASRITPPVLHPQRHPPANPVRLRVELDAGVPLARLYSPYHPIILRELGDGKRLIELAAGEVPADRDFELNWTPAAGHAPQAALFVERKPSRSYALLMLLPPAADSVAARLPREVVFVIDTSGSMSGASIAQAREALELAIARLGAQDRFNLVEFNSTARALWREARPATDDNRRRAAEFVRALRAQGGTEMAPALNLALDGEENPTRVRQVIFLTDGAVGNEDELFKLIGRKLGDSRLFTVGIGSAPNSHFMSRAARTGRGSFTYIGRIEEVKEKISALFAKLESPVLKGIEITWPAGAQAEAWPQRIPDLYLGEPLLVSAALDQLEGEIRISGLRGDTAWDTTLRLDDARRAGGPGVLWAREKIQSLVDSLGEGAAEDEVRNAVVEVALEHHLASKYTSLVAVDRTPVRPAEAPLKSGAIPTNLPAGWQYEAVFGELPQGATDARFNLLAGALALLLALGFFTAGRRRPAATPGAQA